MKLSIDRLLSGYLTIEGIALLITIGGITYFFFIRKKEKKKEEAEFEKFKKY